MDRIGCVMLPSIFGTSLSFRMHAWKMWPYAHIIRVDIYQDQNFWRPFYRNILSGKNDVERMDDLAFNLRESVIFEHIALAINRLQSISACNRIILVGFGMGGIMALKYAEDPRDKDCLGGVVAWYPNLIYPDRFASSKKPPNLLQVSCPMLLFFGAHDTSIAEGTIQRAVDLSTSIHQLEVVVYPDTPHGFADATIQYCIPNLLWRPKISKRSWQRMIDWLKKSKVIADEMEL